MRPATVTLSALVTLVACERLDDAVDVPHVAPESTLELGIETTIAQGDPPPPPGAGPPLRPGPVVPRPRSPAALPLPPTDEPIAYDVWFQALPREDQRRVNSHCRKHPRSYQLVCGGIGHLHIPYPPYPRARPHMGAGPDAGPTIHLDHAQWEAALTPAQRRYIARMCPPDEGRPSSDLCGDNTPLVVAFAGEPVTFAAGATFAFAPGVPTATDWPTAATPWIALDRDGNGSIDSGAELFGSDTVLPSGATAVDGFVALATLDANGDGRIDAADPGFASLVLWADRDGDARSAPGELRPLADLVVSISLAAYVETRCDARANCEQERAALTWRDAAGTLRTGAVVDVYLPRR